MFKSLPLDYTTTRENRELRRYKPNRVTGENYTTTRENRELRQSHFALNPTRILYHYERKQGTTTNLAPSIFICYYNQIVCVVNTCGYVRQSEM